MDNATWKGKPIWLLVNILPAIAACSILILALKTASIPVSASREAGFGPNCGIAIIDGNIHADEWSSASTQTFEMVSPSGAGVHTSIYYQMVCPWEN